MQNTTLTEDAMWTPPILGAVHVRTGWYENFSFSFPLWIFADFARYFKRRDVALP